MWDVLYAIDASTSMGETARLSTGAAFVKVEAVREGIIQTMKSSPFPHGARVGIIGFRAATKNLGMSVDMGQEMVQEVLPLTEVAEVSANPAMLIEKLNTLEVGGATPTGEGLRTAVDLLYTRSDDGKRIKKVVLVTDEKSNAGPKPEKILDARLVRRAIVDVVAVGGTADKKTLESLQSVAAKTGGRFTVANEPVEITRALDPKIPYAAANEANALLVEAERVAGVFKVTEKSAVSYNGIAEAARAVRSRLEQKLQEVIINEGQSRGDADLVMSAATNDPKFPVMSMKEFSDRVWSRAAEYAKLQALESRYRSAIKSLSG